MRLPLLYLREVSITERLANQIAARNARVASVGERNGSDVLPPDIVEETDALNPRRLNVASEK
jgi:hypothetical protein